MDNNSSNNNQEMIDGNTRSCYMGDDEEVFSLKNNKNDDTTTTTKITSISTSTSTTNVNAQFDDTNRWTVGKISLFILIAFSVIFHMVDGAQMESLEAQDHYDALSADVIRPAFRYHNHIHVLVTTDHQRLSSSSSSSSSFAGGLDLRRREDSYWTTNGWFGSVYSVVEQVRDAFQVTIYSHDDDGNYNDIDIDSTRVVLETPRGGAAVAGRTRSSSSKKPKPKKKSRSSSSSTSSTSSKDFILSSPDCFVPLKDIAQLTLKDLSMSFRYAVESTHNGFNFGKFLSGVLPRVKKLVDLMSTTTTLARGKNVQAPITGIDVPPSSGDIDAINFCAAMRVFAEWRVLRQVPPGYKGYAVGIGLGQKDIVQNIAKIEQAIHNYIDHRGVTDDNDDDGNKEHNTSNGTVDHHRNKVLISPTLRDLLQYEIDTDLHDNTKLPKLKEKSAAMGLLWVRRQLVYQTAIFKNVLEVPGRFDSSRTAVQDAYDEIYGSLHGWAVQKIFSYSFQAAPEGIEIYKYMNPHRLEEVQQEARSIIMRVPEQKQQRQFGGPLGDLESNNPIERFGRHIGKEWDKIANNVVNEWEKHSINVINEWDKVTGNISQLFGHKRREEHRQHNDKRRRLILKLDDEKVDSEQSIMTDEETMTAREHEIENYINQEMRKDAYENIKVYLEVAGPLLDDLSRLTDEFNMDDPTKV
ncbi:MAG: hypothetical protein ACI8RD_007025 [Bacillariaceae sp.]|jgi:hypothetical protein